MMYSMTEKQGYSCRCLRREDEEKVKLLIKNCFDDFLEGDFWSWKYKLNPDFKSKLVAVAESNGNIIGCNHWLLKNFKLSPSLKTKAILGADIAVDPKYRGKGIGKTLLASLRASDVVKTDKPSIIYIFADPSLAKHFHTPSGGYVPAPDKTVFYFKILNWHKLEANARILNEKISAGNFKDRLSESNLSILFKISDAPPLHLSMTEKGVTIEGKVGLKKRDADITISADLETLQQVGAKKKRLRNVFVALLTRKLRISGSPKKLLALYRNLWILQEIFGRKII